MSISNHGEGHACQLPHCFLLSGHLSVRSQSQCPANTRSRQKNLGTVFQRRRNQNLWTWLQIVLESRVRPGSLGSQSAWPLSEGFSVVPFSMAVFYFPQPVYLGHLEVCKKERPLSSLFIRWFLWCQGTRGHFCGVISVGSSVWGFFFFANIVKQLYLCYVVCAKEKRLSSYSDVHDSRQQFIGALSVFFAGHLMVCIQ